MFVGYDDAGEQACPYADLDEYLCEYVDGEMDPDIRAVFEEILSRDPALAEHVECLRQTRALLGTFGHGVDSPCGFQVRLRQEISREMLTEQAPALAPVTGYLRGFAAAASVLALVLSAGVYVVSDGPLGQESAPAIAVRALPAEPERVAPVYGRAAPVAVAAAQEHYHLSYGRGYPRLAHAPHVRPAFSAHASGGLMLAGSYGGAALAGIP